MGFSGAMSILNKSILNKSSLTPFYSRQYSKASRIKRNAKGLKYVVVIKKAGKNYSAYLPDVPGCIAAGDTPEETLKLLAEALKMHLDGLKEDGLPIPEPTTKTDYIAVQ